MIWKKYKKFIIVISLIGFFWACSIYSIFFLSKKIRAKADSIQEKIIDQESMRKRSQDIPKLEDQDRLIKEKETEMFGLLKQDDAVKLIEKTEGLAEKTGNEINIEIVNDGSKPEKTPPGAAKKEGEQKKTIDNQLPSKDYLQLRIKLTGKYNNFINFLEKLENLEYYSDVISIKTISDENETSPKVAANPEENPVEINGTEIVSNIEVIYYIEK